MRALRILNSLLVASLIMAWQAKILNAQDRINDKDLENLMRNLKDDAKSFRSPFVSALKKSSIRWTSEAKSAENLAGSFQKQTEALLNAFKTTRKGGSELSSVQDSAQRLDTMIRKYQLGPEVTTRWQKIQSELGQGEAAVTRASSASQPSGGILSYRQN